MPPLQPSSESLKYHAVLQRVADEVGVYPIDAFDFVQRGLSYTVTKIHGAPVTAGQSRHISGQQLCEGLREYALNQWGLLARTVLARWSITTTFDFGQIVFSLVRHKEMATTAEDSLEDFRNVYDFKSALEAGYVISLDKV